jgi:heme/copper-type cytochrome/quinol oxidase subunit 2
METENQSELKSVKSTVYDRIQCEKICPRSRGYFLSQECFIWALWIVSIFIGALAVAVTLFVLTYRQYALYEATHENFFTFMVDVLPFLWIAVFALMAFVAVYNIRHTKRGYRYPLWQIFGSSMVLSLAGGTTLQLFGLGYSVDHMLGTQMRMYLSQEKMEQRLWQSPSDGRLLGRLTHHTMAPTTTDATGDSWQVDVSDLTLREQELLAREETVRLIGKVSNDEVRQFHSCGAFPLVINKNMTREDLHAAREAFVMKVQSYKEQAEKVTRDAEKMAMGSVPEDEPESPCGAIAVVERMEESKKSDSKDEDDGSRERENE